MIKTERHKGKGKKISCSTISKDHEYVVSFIFFLFGFSIEKKFV